MARNQQSFVNRQDAPIYISVEPWPYCFELEPDDRLTLTWDAPATGDAIKIDFVTARELVVWPNGEIDDIDYQFNGAPGLDRAWVFKHPIDAAPAAEPAARRGWWPWRRK